jgi:hypothetical protein
MCAVATSIKPMLCVDDCVAYIYALERRCDAAAVGGRSAPVSDLRLTRVNPSSPSRCGPALTPIPVGFTLRTSGARPRTHGSLSDSTCTSIVVDDHPGSPTLVAPGE